MLCVTCIVCCVMYAGRMYAVCDVYSVLFHVRWKDVRCV